jgi:hypothetical protein
MKTFITTAALVAALTLPAFGGAMAEGSASSIKAEGSAKSAKSAKAEGGAKAEGQESSGPGAFAFSPAGSGQDGGNRK